MSESKKRNPYSKWETLPLEEQQKHYKEFLSLKDESMKIFFKLEESYNQVLSMNLESLPEEGNIKLSSMIADFREDCVNFSVKLLKLARSNTNPIFWYDEKAKGVLCTANDTLFLNILFLITEGCSTLPRSKTIYNRCLIGLILTLARYQLLLAHEALDLKSNKQ